MRLIIIIWLSLQWNQSRPTGNRWMTALFAKLRPILEFFSIDATWQMFAGGKALGWVMYERIEAKVQLAGGESIDFSQVFDGGLLYQHFLVNYIRDKGLQNGFLLFIEKQCRRLGYNPVSVEIWSLYKPRPAVNVRFWLGRYDHQAFLVAPLKTALIARRTVKTDMETDRTMQSHGAVA